MGEVLGVVFCLFVCCFAECMCSEAKRAQEEAQDAAGGQLLLFLPLAFYSGLCAILHPSNKTKTITRVTCVYSLGFFFLNNH